MIAIVNTNIILENGIVWDGTLTMDEERIIYAGAGGNIPSEAEVIDAGGEYTAPGFVDIHNHGGDGVWFTEDPLRACRHFLSHGETTVLPTLYTNLDAQGYIEGIRAVREAMGDKECSIIGGLYMEGPYMNPKYGSDAKNNKWKGAVDPKVYRPIVDEAGALVKVWCVAPEREGVEEFVKYASSVNPGAVFSVAHSEASPGQIYSLKPYGLKSQTHHMNATGAPSAIFGIRGAGPDEANWCDPDMYAELICDSLGIHVLPHNLRMAVHIKGTERIILISDSTPFGGRAPKGFEHVTDLCYDSEGNIAGSKLTLDVAVCNMMSHTNCGLCEAVKFASLNPARLIGMDGELGSIAPGKLANLVIMDGKANVKTVFLRGKQVM